MSRQNLSEYFALNSKANLSYKNDVYFNENYAKLYGEAFCFEYKKAGCEFKAIAIKERIKDSEYFDLQSPYGYSGFYSNSSDEAFLSEAFLALKNAAKAQNIIAFFIRFHPFDENLFHYKTHLNFFTKDRKIVLVPTNKPLCEIRGAYSPRIKSYAKKARNELELSICNASHLDDFIKLYYETMQRNKADKFYFFDENYFKKLFDLKENLILKASLNGANLAFASFFVCEDFGYYHLSANTGEKNANLAILDYFFEICSQKNVKFAILGGGVKDDDNLFAFKQKFSQLFAEFYIGGIVFNEQIYEKFKANLSSKNFLAYRF